MTPEALDMQPRPRVLRASHPGVPHGYHWKPGLMGVIDGPLVVTAIAAAACVRRLSLTGAR